MLAQGAGAQPEYGFGTPGTPDPDSVAELERQAFAILFGFDSTGDTATAMRLLEQAAAAGSAVAADRLAAAYGTGEGVAMDVDRAMQLERQAAEGGSAQAQFRLGMRYLNGESGSADPAEARKWLEASAAQGDARALFALAGTYLRPTYEETDMDTVVALLTRSAELGEAAALRQLGQLLLRDPNWLDPEKGIHALELAADNFPELAGEIGFHYFSGRLVERNPEKAVRWLSQAAARGNLNARLLLSELLQRGLGVTRNPQLADQIQDEIVRNASSVDKNNLAWSLSVSPDPFLRDGPFAVRLMESLPDTPEELTAERLDTLAAAYAEVGRFSDAVAAQQRAVDLLRGQADAGPEDAEGAAPSLAGFRERLELYRSERAFRLPE